MFNSYKASRKIILVLISISFFYLSSYAQKTIQNIDDREKLSLNGPWKYIIDPYQMGYLDYRLMPFDESKSGKGGFYDNLTNLKKTERAEYDFTYEPTLQVPGDWNSQDERLEFYEGTLWYKRDFVIAPKTNKRYFLHFGAINYESHIYLNGKKLGVHKGGFTPFQFEVSEKLNDGNNFVVVMANNTRKKDEIPTINTDWWNYGGITRDVAIVETAVSFINDYKVQLAKNDNKTIKGFIELNGFSKSEKVVLEIPELNIKSNFMTDENGIVEFNIPVKKVKYWSPEKPKL